MEQKDSEKARHEIKIAQKPAWFGLNRIGEAWSAESARLFSGPVEINETCIGGRRKNMPKAKRAALSGHGGVGKSIVAGTKGRATKRVSAAVSAAVVGECARAQVCVHDIERFGSFMKRVCTGIFHHISAQHLRRCVVELAR